MLHAFRRPAPSLALLVACALAPACSGNVDTDQPPVPGGTGGAAGHAGDAASDAKPDAVDAAKDALPEAMPDHAVPDVPDAKPDAPDAPDLPDAKLDGPDAKPDAPDAKPDSNPQDGAEPDAQDAAVGDGCVPETEVCDGVDNNCNGAVDEGCPCSSGQTQPCYDGPAGTQDVGPCHGGTQTCDLNGTWGACVGEVVPVTEACNDLDDDCSAKADDGDPNAMCGANPPHATVACLQGDCGLGACDPGWTQFPPGNPSQGCACEVDPNEPNDTCATAVNAGTVLDTSGGPVTFAGTLSSATDVDVWQLSATDVDELTTNSFHLVISFVSPNPNNEFLFDVVRGDVCTDTPTGPLTGIVRYDWGVAGKSANGLEGESPCSPAMPVHCGDHSSKYFVRVYRRAGATPSCNDYLMLATAQGGISDFTMKCE